LGALYAGANDTQVESLAAYGRYLGLAFQVADDLLDLVGDEATAGKTLGTDLDEQKMTLPMIHALRHLPPGEAEQLQQMICQGSSARAKVAEVLHRAGSVEYARERAADYVRLARNSLAPLPRNEYRGILEHLTDWSIRREK
jgi:octaprenyl-diphosphate synthase